MNPNPNLFFKQENDKKNDMDVDSSWWTGREPKYGVCPGVTPDGIIHSLPLINLNQCSRKDIQDYFDNSWTLTEVLFSSIIEEKTLYRAPYHGLRHPLIFYIGHTASLYVNKLLVAGLIEAPINKYFEQLFETGVDEMSWDDMSKNEMRWPTLEEVQNYRRQVYYTVKNLIEAHPVFDIENSPIDQQSSAWALFMAFEHERIHLETSSVLIRELPHECLKRPAAWPSYHPSAGFEHAHPPKPGNDYPVNKLVSVDEKNIQLGKPKDWPSFGWDNEYGSRSARVRPFRASQFLISNGEFLEFVAAGGYHEEKYWSDTGWEWRKFRNVKWPTFWVAYGPAGLHQYKLRTCFEVINMPWSWPAEVNYHEAQAYCTWLSEKENRSIPYRVITEAEHNAIRDDSCFDESLEVSRDCVMTMGGEKILAEKQGNFNLAYGAGCPVDASKPSSSGFYDVFGNAWEWCEDDFNPLDDFGIHPLYDDFSTPCFDGKHNMIMGGSFISSGDEASIWSRFHFRPHFYQHASFRIVCPNDDNPACDAVKLEEQGSGNVYESEQMLNEYLLLHYGEQNDVLPYDFGPKETVGFPKRCAQLINELTSKYRVSTNRVIDVGCAVGGAVFELARTYEEVVGIDLSEAFIRAANTLKDEGRLSYSRRDEGKLCTPMEVVIDSSVNKKAITFRQADACCIPIELQQFDVALLANLVDRLPSPKSCLARMGGHFGLVREGGLLVVASPYTWLEQFTPEDAWLGGYEKDNQKVATTDGLQQALGEQFTLLEQRDVPLIIREHVRKYQYIVTHVTVWQRKISDKT